MAQEEAAQNGSDQAEKPGWAALELPRIKTRAHGYSELGVHDGAEPDGDVEAGAGGAGKSSPIPPSSVESRLQKRNGWAANAMRLWSRVKGLGTADPITHEEHEAQLADCASAGFSRCSRF